MSELGAATRIRVDVALPLLLTGPFNLEELGLAKPRGIRGAIPKRQQDIRKSKASIGLGSTL
jgi:hypothetical protein